MASSSVAVGQIEEMQQQQASLKPRSKKTAIANDEPVPAIASATSHKKRKADTALLGDEDETSSAPLFHLFYSDDFDTLWPLQPAAIVIARNEKEAITQLNASLAKKKYKTYVEHPYTLHRVPLDSPCAVILSDGGVPARFENKT